MNVRNFISLCLLHLVKCFLHVEHIQALTVLDVIYLAVIDTQCLSFSHHLVAGNMFHDDSVDDVLPYSIHDLDTFVYVRRIISFFWSVSRVE